MQTRQEAIKEQKLKCNEIKLFLKKKAMATNKLYHASLYAEACGIIDEYIYALEESEILWKSK